MIATEKILFKKIDVHSLQWLKLKRPAIPRVGKDGAYWDSHTLLVEWKILQPFWKIA